MKKDFSIVFIPTFLCNSNCSHCFEEITPQTIDDHLWVTIFTEMHKLATFKNLRRLLIYWQGGEVMAIGPGAVRKGLEICAGIFEDNGVQIEHHFQTNLLLYDSRWKNIVSEYFSGNISSSLDFPNLYRTTKSFDQKGYIREWLKKKGEAENDGFIVNVITLPNTETVKIGAPAFYRYFAEEVGIRNVQINFPFPGVDGKNPELLKLDELADFMENLYYTWVDSDRYLNLNPFSALENRIFESKGRVPCNWSYNCADFLLAVGPDGEVGLCDCWVSTHKEYGFGYMGKQMVSEILDSPKREDFVNRPINMIRNSECGECEYWMICFGGCPIRALTFSGDIFSKDHYCPVYKRIFSVVLKQHQRGDGRNDGKIGRE